MAAAVAVVAEVMVAATEVAAAAVALVADPHRSQN